MGEDLRRAAFFDLALNSWESFEVARVALESHRSAGDLLILLRAESGVDLLSGPADGAWGEGPTEPVPPGRDCLRIAIGAGESKSWAVVEAMAKLGLDATRCFAYGDHHDSLGTLGVVGNPRVLGGDPDLAEYARNRGWPIISAAPPLTC